MNSNTAATAQLSAAEDYLLMLMSQDMTRKVVIEACERLRERTMGADVSRLKEVLDVLENWNDFL